MKHNVNMKNLLKFEREYKLKQREIYGVNYWYCRRTRTLNDIIAIANGQQNMCDKEKIKMTRFFSFKNFIDKKNKNIDILLITDARRIKQGNRYESIYTDEIERIVKDKFSCLTLEEPSWTCYMSIKTSHYYNCTTKNIKYVDLYEYEAKLKIILFKRFNIKKLKNIEKEVEILINEINNYFDIDISTIKDDYVDHIIYFIVMKKRYTKLIEKINPKCVIFYYRDFPFKTLIQMISKEKKLITIEMQHGTYTDDEPIEKKGDSSEEWKNIPDYLFSFGKLQTSEQFLIYKKDKIKYIGNLFLEKKQLETINLPDWYDYKKKYILFISQSSMGKYISRIASKLADLLKNTEYKIIYKFHPNESGRNYECLKKENIIQIKDNSEEIYMYQKICFVQVGVSSTAIFEGISFYNPTIILKNPEKMYGVENILRKFKKGIYFANNVEDVRNIINGKIEKPLDEDLNMLWEKNSSINFLREIENIMKN